MAQHSKIEWCDHTFNPWQGCTKISPGCDHCYAESWSQRSGLVQWGGERRRSSEGYWRQPLKWDRQAEAAQRPARVFCCSLADVFDNQVPEIWRVDLLNLVLQTPWLRWLLLTKRIGNAGDMLPHSWGAIGGLPHVAIGASICSQEEADRDLPKLAATPARLRFVSCEPLLGDVDLGRWLGHGIDWVIAGGESGPHARPSHPDWFRSLRDQCAAAGVPFFFKQWGEWAPHRPQAGGDLGGDVRAGRVQCVHPSGRDCVQIFVDTNGSRQSESGSRYMRRVGKKSAGAMLDGIEHRAFPAL